MANRHVWNTCIMQTDTPLIRVHIHIHIHTSTSPHSCIYMHTHRPTCMHAHACNVYHGLYKVILHSAQHPVDPKDSTTHIPDNIFPDSVMKKQHILLWTETDWWRSIQQPLRFPSKMYWLDKAHSYLRLSVSKVKHICSFSFILRWNDSWRHTILCHWPNTSRCPPFVVFSCMIYFHNSIWNGGD